MSIVRWIRSLPKVVLAEKSLHRSPRYREWLFTEKVHHEKPFRITVIFQHPTSEWEPRYVFTPPQPLFVFRCSLHDLFHHSICERINTIHTTRETNSTHHEDIACWFVGVWNGNPKTTTRGGERKIGAPLQQCSRIRIFICTQYLMHKIICKASTTYFTNGSN